MSVAAKKVVSAAGAPQAASNRTADLRLELARSMAFAFCTADALVEVTPDGNVAHVTGATKSLFGLSNSEIIGSTFKSLAIKEDQPLITALFELAEKGQRFTDMMVRFSRKSEDNAYAMLSGYQVPDLGKNCYLTIKALADEEGPLSSANRDTESGLLNSDGFGNAIGDYFEKGDGDKKLTFVGLSGMSALKGRLVQGEWLLMQKRIGSFLKAVSTDGEVAAQLSSGKYGILHDKNLDIGHVEKQIKQISKDADPMKVGCESSANSAQIESLGLTGPDLTRAVLFTINHIAEGGEIDYADKILSSDITEHLVDTANKVSLIKRTIKKNQFDIAYQPIVNIENGEIHHFEALLRQDDPTSLLSTLEFVCFSEDIGLAATFDLAMCHKLINRLSSMLSRGNLLPVAVNLSGKSVESKGFAERLVNLLNESPKTKNHLIFEITETANISDMDAASAFVKHIRGEGYPVCLDDFGTGAVAFEYLRRMEVDYVKIDGQYIDDATRDIKGQAFLTALSGLCRDLGIATIAERVETRGVIEFLHDIDVQFAQGYFFGKPDPAADLSGVRQQAKRKGEFKSWE